jgi:hypothetical protein
MKSHTHSPAPDRLIRLVRKMPWLGLLASRLIHFSVGQREFATRPAELEGALHETATPMDAPSALRWIRSNAWLKSQRPQARALVRLLMNREDTGTFGQLSAAVIALANREPRAALRAIRQLPANFTMTHAPGEMLCALLCVRHQQAESVADDVLQARLSVDSQGLFNAAKGAVVARRFDLAEKLASLAATEIDKLPSTNQRRALAWMRKELTRRNAFQKTPETPLATVQFGILDYKMLDFNRMSSNIGDYIQSLAALSHFAALRGINFVSPERGLAEFLSRLSLKVPETAKRPASRKTVSFVPLNRDTGSAATLHRQTWTVAFGWYMHPEFGGLYDFPFAPHVRPIFISFHLNKRHMLTSRTIDYLTRHGPVGCRDWSTVYILREYDIPAFFSGCITSTLGTIFPREQHSDKSDKTAVVDYPTQPDEFPEGKTDFFRQSTGVVKRSSIVDNLKSSYTLLQRYRPYGQVVTSRLHCYFPCRALGLEVDFRPGNKADPRFEGLLGIDDAAFVLIKEGIQNKLHHILVTILAGAEEDKVYAEWRRICAPDVAVAEAYCRNLPKTSTADLDLLEIALKIASTVEHHTPPNTAALPIHVAIVDEGHRVEKQLSSLKATATDLTQGLHLHLAASGMTSQLSDKATSLAASGIYVSVYDIDKAASGAAMAAYSPAARIRMARVLLPNFLAHLEKIIYWEKGRVVGADLTSAWNAKHSHHRISARPVTSERVPLVHDLIERDALKLDAVASSELRRRASLLGCRPHAAFESSLVALDLRGMRDDGFSRDYWLWAGRLGASWQSILNAYSRGKWSPLDVRP